jgi:hypothetical protein
MIPRQPRLSGVQPQGAHAIIITKEPPMTTMEATAGAVSASAPPTAAPLHSTRAHASALSVRLWVSPTDRRRLTKLREKIADITGQAGSHSVLLRAGISALELTAELTAAELKKQPETKGRRQYQLLWWLAQAARRVGDEDR